MMNTQIDKKQRPGQVCIIIDPSIKRDAKVYAAMHGITLGRLYEEAVRAFIGEAFQRTSENEWKAGNMRNVTPADAGKGASPYHVKDIE